MFCLAFHFVVNQDFFLQSHYGCSTDSVMFQKKDVISKLEYYFKKAKRSYSHYMCYHTYSSHFKRYLKLQNFENKKAKGEDDYINKWKALSSRVEPYSYRFFSHFCGYNPNIIPEDIGHSYIEEILNPLECRYVYEDKNYFPKRMMP